jgi:3'-5' exoribonuclease
MPHRFINQFADGESIDDCYLVSEKQIRANRQAALYLLVELRDRTGGISARLWNVSEDAVATFNAGDVARVRGKVQVYQGALQVILNNISLAPAGSYDMVDLVRQSTSDTGQLTQRMREILLSITNPHVRSLMECFLIDERFLTAFASAPAGTKAHHAYRGGLIEHVVNMLEVVVRIADLYPSVDRDLWLAGVFLHDMAKVRELSFENGFAYTDEGQLIGHLVIAVEMLDEKIAEAAKLTGEPFPQDTALRLKHMVVSHHGKYEFGSPKLPMTPEAIALHHLDNLDAKVHEFSRDIAEDPNAQSSWTPFNARLDRKLFKGMRPATS